MSVDRIYVRWLSPAAVNAETGSALVSLLDDDEKRVWQRKAVEKDKKLYLLAHALRRKMLSDLTGRRSESWKFSSDVYGCPHLDDDGHGEEIHFSLSHTDGLAIAAVSAVCPVGLDAERLSRRIGEVPLKVVMSPAEQKRIAMMGPEEGIRLWALKEAYSKAIGRGLHIRFADLDFSDGISESIEPPRGFDAWRSHHLLVGEDHVAALVFPVHHRRTMQIDARAVSEPSSLLRTYDRLEPEPEPQPAPVDI